MAKKVVIFDNNITMLAHLSEIVERCGYEPILCDRIMAANNIWEKNYQNIDAIILDLNMPTNGLNDEQVERTINGRLTGWIWFMDTVVHGSTPNPVDIKKTIIFSGFIPDLEKNINSDEEKILLNTLTLVDKSDNKAWNKIKTFLNNI
jgi:DNA-binding NtrC family response regulator